MFGTALELALTSIFLLLISAPLNWICEADAESYAISKVGESRYLRAVGRFRKNHRSHGGLIKWLVVHLERLPWDLQYRFIMFCGMHKKGV